MKAAAGSLVCAITINLELRKITADTVTGRVEVDSPNVRSICNTKDGRPATTDNFGVFGRNSNRATEHECTRREQYRPIVDGSL